MLNRLLLSSVILSTVMLPSSQAATNFSGKNAVGISLKGSLNTQYGAVNQSSAFKYQNGNKLRNRALVNDGKVKIEANYKTSENLKYGAMLQINANTSNSDGGNSYILNKTLLFVEGPWGRAESGSYSGPSSSLKDSALGPLSTATGGAYGGDAPLWINSKTASGYNLDIIYILSPDLPVTHDASGSANKITYYTPKWNGLQLGISYIPESSTKGTITKAMSIAKDTFVDADGSGNDPRYYAPGYKNIFDLSLKHDFKANDISIASFISGQFGESKKYKDNSLHSRRPLAAFDLGTVVTYKDFSFGASYGDWGLSGVYKSLPKQYKRKSFYYTLGAAYNYQDFTASLTYLNAKAATGKHGGFKQYSYDKTSVTSLGMQYKVLDGLATYAEYTHLNLAEHNQPKNKANVFLVGTKLSF